MDYSSKPRAAGGSIRPVLIAVVASFLLGAAVAGYFAWRTYGPRGDDPETQFDNGENAVLPATLTGSNPTPSPSPTATAARTARQVEEIEAQQGGIDQRLAAAEQRLARLDLQAQAAAGNAARAEGLLIAFATRRAIERGAELGYLADQLRLRFGDALPNAVDTVISFSRDPVTLDVLLARLEGLAPQLENVTQENGLARLRRELSELFIIRRESTPSPRPQRRLERARFFLESGRVNRAIAEVANLPGATHAESWIEDAKRYAAAQRALDLIETSAVLEPRRLRDGTGNPVEQLSPAEEAAEPQLRP